ncbi:hypothetical protein MY10362_001751 [Beauveria mimosiformis]
MLWVAQALEFGQAALPVGSAEDPRSDELQRTLFETESFKYIDMIQAMAILAADLTNDWRSSVVGTASHPCK